MGKKLDFLGKKIGRWTVVKENGRFYPGGHILWFCVCECGNTQNITGNTLKSGNSTSCGCYHAEMVGNMVRTHGATKCKDHKETREYTSWMQMKSRCRNTNLKSYKDYGGRGVTVCSRWLGEDGFINFLSDMGERPEGHSLDRYPNNNGNYEPSNCRWATRPQQQRGRRNNIWLEHEGERLVMTDWLKRIAMPYSTFQYHVKKGRTIEDIIQIVKNKKTAA